MDINSSIDSTQARPLQQLFDEFQNSQQMTQLGTLSMIAQRSALVRGKVKLALLYVVGAAISYKNNAAGFLAQILLRLYRKVQ